MNPWLGQSTSQYYLGSSPGGSLFATLGTGLAGLADPAVLGQNQNTWRHSPSGPHANRKG